ncbi:MAG TPA: glycolate oxidase subunit GlcE [Alphaproteobacteria bacterium]|jgi:glycolate oxidase FAD binding subunit|nr:glycolate oxidase subunit GlcE [Alphaproteobacteria bacterium]
MDTLQPTTIDELRDAVAQAISAKRSLEVRGGGSKRDIGRPTNSGAVLALDRLAGVLAYEPAELVLTANAGTPLGEVERLLADNKQMLAFEPPDWSRLLGSNGAAPTLGGALGCNLAGPRRIKIGAARDHFLGFNGVSGHGDIFKAGGKVVKNVTGYDVSKLMAGSYGTLAALAEVTVKVMPRPEESRTLLIMGLTDERAIAALADGLNSPHEVSGAAHLPATVAAASGVGAVAGAGASVAALRVEGPGTSVAFRVEELRQMFASRAPVAVIEGDESQRLWREIADVRLLPIDGRAVWRISVPPASGPATFAAVARTTEATGFYDWGGGLLWAAVPETGEAAARGVRAAVGGNGHATLIRAPDAVRATVPVFEPLPAALAALTRRVKESFDPQRIFNPGRMYPDV